MSLLSNYLTMLCGYSGIVDTMLVL